MATMGLIAIFGLLLFTVSGQQEGCNWCGECLPDPSCTCATCPDLQTAFDYRSPINLIAKVNITTVLDSTDGQSYMGDLLETYQASGSGIVFKILPQDFTAPCFTAFYKDIYLMAIPWHLITYQNPDSDADFYKVECFYVAFDRCSYFKLWSELTADEIGILAKHS